MAELIPILGGLVGGVATGFLAEGSRARLALMIAWSVVVGVLAGLVSGELSESPAFLALDVPAAFLAAAVGLVTSERLRRSGGLLGPVEEEGVDRGRHRW